MANIRVTCPACKTELEIDAAFEGQEVECGNCLEVFKAETPGTKKSSGAGASSRGKKPADDPDEKPARKKRRDDDDDYEHDRRRRDDDDDDEDDYEPPPPRRRGGGVSGLALTSLITGICAIPFSCCCLGWVVSIPLGITATVSGGLALQKPDGKPLAIIGICLGVIALLITFVQFLTPFGMPVGNQQFR